MVAVVFALPEGLEIKINKCPVNLSLKQKRIFA